MTTSTAAGLTANARVAAPVRTIYLPYMADHVVAIAGALEHFDIPCEVLPPPDDESLAIGLDLCRGRECLPCFLSTGDIIRACRKGLDLEHAAILMPTTPGPCRFGQYRVLQRQLLDREGYGALEIISPTSDNSYRGFGEHPHRLRLLVWNGIVAVDLLLRLLYEHRPYERVAGDTDAAYRRGLVRIQAATAKGGGTHLVRAMDEIAEDFTALNVDRSVPRPVVAVVGEIYVMLNAQSNQELIRQLELAGAEVVTGSLGEWFHFSDETKVERSRLYGEWTNLFGTRALGAYQRMMERRLFSRVASLLRHPPDPPMRELMAGARPYYDTIIGTETLLTIAKVVDYARQGVSGVVNVMPFSCMPGLVVAGLAASLRRDVGMLPWLDISYDGQRVTNIRTRLEAFVHQVGQFSRRHDRAAAPPAQPTFAGTPAAVGGPSGAACADGDVSVGPVGGTVGTGEGTDTGGCTIAPPV